MERVPTQLFFEYAAMLVTLQLVALSASAVQGHLLGMFILPHGGIALSPSDFETNSTEARDLAYKINAACTSVGETIVGMAADTVILITPHGMSDRNNFLLYQNPTAAGFADTDNCDCPTQGCCYNVTLNVDVDMAPRLLAHLLELGHNVSGLSAFGPPAKHGATASDFPLRWGEVIPASFLVDSTNTTFVFVSIPYRRYEGASIMLPEAINIGQDIHKFVKKSPRGVVLVVSADLAHTHDPDGPYGFSEDAQKFDAAVAKWVETQTSEELTRTAASYERHAKSCGLLGLGLLEGVLVSSKEQEWQSTLHVIGHPSYYGMLVASYRQAERMVPRKEIGTV